MDELIFAGNKYISSRRAGKLAGYTTDYLGQMCRADKIDCRFVGRNWYINERELEGQKKDFKKEQTSKSREIEYKKIELEPMYYSNDERSNYPEISKVIHNDIEEIPTAVSTKEEQPVPLHIVKRYTPRPLQRQGEQKIIRRQEVVSRQIHRGFPVASSVASILMLIGTLFAIGTFTLEQVMHYSSEDGVNVSTSFQLANIIKTL